MTVPEETQELQQDERRRHARTSQSLSVPIFYTMSSGYRFEFEGRLLDASPGGVGIALPEEFWCPVNRGDRVVLQLKGGDQRVLCDAQIARLGESKSGIRLLGIEFTDVLHDLVGKLVERATLSIEMEEELNSVSQTGPDSP